MAKAFPAEFRRDVVAVARKHEAPLNQIAKDFGVSEATLHNWLKRADVEEGVREGTTSADQKELRESRKRIKLLEQENYVLRRAAAYLGQQTLPKMMYPLVTDLADEEIPVAVTCRVLKFSTQGYYKWKAKPVCDRDLSDAYLINAAVDAHHDDPTFGYRFIADELETLGFEASENRVQRLCSLQRIWSVHAKKRGLNRRPGPPVHDDLVERDFTAPAANVLWLTDITEHRTGEGKLYLCAIKDAFSNRIVGYSMDARMPAALAVAALNNALMTRDVASTIVHSDRGSQFRATVFVRALVRAELRGSMGRVATCADNAAMESFFSLLQKNVLDTKRWATREELRLAIATWIERTYNRRRRQRILGRLTPVEYETIYSSALAA